MRTIGFSPFGAINEREKLERVYGGASTMVSTKATKDGAPLNAHHTHFLLVDSGKHGVKACSDRDQPAGVALHLIAIPSEAWGREGDQPVSPLSSPLNRHSSWAKAWGTEINLRVAFESFYLERKSVPMVLLVVQGGPGTTTDDY